MGESGQPRHHPVRNRSFSTTPPPGQGHQQHQQGIALPLDGKAHGVRAAEGQQQRQGQHTPPAFREGHGLGHHHATPSQIGQPGEQPQTDGGLAHQLPPAPEQAVIQRGMRVLPQHPQQRQRAGLKAFSNAVELIAPQGCGIDQQESPQGEGRRHQSGHKRPDMSRASHRP